MRFKNEEQKGCGNCSSLASVNVDSKQTCFTFPECKYTEKNIKQQFSLALSPSEIDSSARWAWCQPGQSSKLTQHWTKHCNTWKCSFAKAPHLTAHARASHHQAALTSECWPRPSPIAGPNVWSGKRRGFLWSMGMPEPDFPGWRQLRSSNVNELHLFTSPWK